MNDDVIDDLKHFITVTVSQQISGLEQKVDGLERRINARFDENDEKLNEILDVLGQNQIQADERLDDHEQRIVKLERKAA